MRAGILAPLLLLLWSSPIRAQGVRSDAAERPNIIVILIDDMGYGDLGVTGNTRVATPAIDRLAREGTLFTQFYVNAPVCSPSRVAITTGMYPSRWDIHSFLASRAQNRARGMADWLDPRAPTLARTLRKAGYQTGHFGKWHMGGGRDVDDAPLITEYGFDESLTQFEGLGDRYLWKDGLNEQSARLGRGEVRWTEKHEMTRHYVDHAIDFIRRHRDQPFYINLWPDDVHTVHLPAPGRAEKHSGIARNADEAAFFAVLEEMDRQLGRLFVEIRRLGLDESTLILLTSDNGPTDAARLYRDGNPPPGSTAGYRGRKLSLYEGGIRMPLIAHWPGHVPAGRVDEETVLAAIDLVPSLARLAGTSVASEYDLDGEDMSRAFLGESARRRGPIYWYYLNNPRPHGSSFLSPNYAVRDGRWKLLINGDGTRAELYDLEADPRETTNLVEAHPPVATRLQEKVMAWGATLSPDVPISPIGLEE